MSKVKPRNFFDSVLFGFAKKRLPKSKTISNKFFFRARLVKMSPSLSKTRSSKNFSRIFKKTNQSQKLDRGNFFWV